MKIFPAKDNIQRTEQELRLQPFTLLTLLPVVLTVAAGLTYTCVYSDDEGAVIRHGLLSLLIAAPTIVLFAVVWRKEARRPFPLRARRVAWRAMFYAYVAVWLAIGLLILSPLAPGKNRWHLITAFLLSLPTGGFLYTLLPRGKKG